MCHDSEMTRVGVVHLLALDVPVSVLITLCVKSGYLSVMVTLDLTTKEMLATRYPDETKNPSRLFDSFFELLLNQPPRKRHRQIRSNEGAADRLHVSMGFHQILD